MPYDNAVPQAAQRISASQQPILNNFIEIGNDFALNHVPLTAGANNGKHNLVQFVSQIPAYLAVAGAAAGEVNIYNKLPQIPFVATNRQELFIVRSGADALNVPITSRNAYVGGNPSSNWFYLPCGLLVKWGRATYIAVGDPGVNLDAIGQHYAPPTNPTVFLSAERQGGGFQPSISLAICTANLLTVVGTNAVGASTQVSYSWMTIGVAALVP